MGSSDVDFFIHSYYEFKLFGTTLSINTTMVTTVIVCLILLALILFARHEIMKNYDEPNVVQNVVEMIVEKMDAMVETDGYSCEEVPELRGGADGVYLFIQYFRTFRTTAANSRFWNHIRSGADHICDD